MIEILSNGNISGNIIIINSIFDLKNKDITNKIIVTKELTLEMLTDIYNVKGIIVEKGNMLSHIFIFLREIGIPCIKQEDATTYYQENDFVDI